MKKLLNELNELFLTSNLPIAKIAALACGECANKNIKMQPQQQLATHDEIKKSLQSENNLPIANTVLEIMDNLSWHYSGYEDGRISADVALRMQTCELLGPDGMIFYEKCRVGLFAQTANTNYIIRNHAAEELFVKIAGEGEWLKGEGEYEIKNAGAFIHHGSYENHASRTKAKSLVAFWVWHGDIDYGKYKYKDS